MLASDDANTQFVGAKDPDAALVAEFYLKPIQDMFQSSKQGRPIFSDVIYVHINVPGIKDSDWHIVARSDHQQRFPRQWAHFQNKMTGDAREVGTPLAEWPVLTRSQVEEFRGLKFFTIESIANAGDAQISNLGMMGGMSPHILRDKARAYLKAAADSALPQHQAEELAKRDAEIDRLSKEMARLAAAVDASMKAPTPPPPQPVADTPNTQMVAKRRPGRPTNAEIAARKAAAAEAQRTA